jgi:hypothetical protein
MFVLKDSLEPGMKRKIQCGEFWMVDCNNEHFGHGRQTIRPHSAILADSWEENAKPGTSFIMKADDLTAYELELVHKTWNGHVADSLPAIFELADWSSAEVVQNASTIKDGTEPNGFQQEKESKQVNNRAPLLFGLLNSLISFTYPSCNSFVQHST